MVLVVQLVTRSVLFLCVFICVPGMAQRPEPITSNSSEIEIMNVQGNVSVIATGGSNIAVMTGDQGLIIVDGGNIEAASNVVERIQNISIEPPRYIINTTPLPGHLGGNVMISAIGATLPGNALREGGAFGIPIVGHANALTLLATKLSEVVPYDNWPYLTFFGESKDLYLNDEAIIMFHQPAAITDSDIIVYFRKSDVLVTGDILDMTSYPHFYSEFGGSLQGVIDALNEIIEISIPEANQQGGTLIIPGHGRIASESDVVEYRDMLTIIRDRFSSMIEQGLSFEEILNRQPTLEYDGIYGYSTGSWTTSMFLEAVYEELR